MRLIIDLDGTCFEFHPSATLDDLMQPGYFANLLPYSNMIEGLWLFHNKYPEVEMIISSKVLNEEHIIKDKDKAVNNYLHFIKERKYIPYGKKKTDYLIVKPEDYLLDDYTDNLFEFEEAGGKGIKVLNGINGHHGRWKGPKIFTEYPAWLICDELERLTKLNKKEGRENEME